MLTTIIVDDERLNITLLESDIKKYCPELTVVGTAQTVATAVELIIHKKPDLLFLDIQLHDQTAFDILDTLKNDNLHVIFITAYEHHGIQAIKHGVIDYLLKPIQLADLLNAVKKVIAKTTLQKKHDNGIVEKEFLHIHTREHVELVKLTDIIHLTANGAYTEIHLTNNRKMLTSKALKIIEEQIHSHHFLRVHNSHVINIHFIDKVIKSKYGSLILKNGFEIPISASKRKEVADTLGLKTNHVEE